jgi:uncharacterized protein (DUF362 family)
MLASIIADKIDYPPSDEHFSPHEAYPEYRFSHVARRPNEVYAAVRSSFRQAGLDIENHGTPRWNPLGRWVRPGARVFVLCNFVTHKGVRESALDFEAKCTHGSVLRAVCDYLLIACGPEGTVTFGNAPVQECDFDRVLEETRAAVVRRFYERESCRVGARDLRLYRMRRSVLGYVHSDQLEDAAGGVEITLRETSELSALSGSQNRRFRIANYRPERTEAFHSRDSHRYVVSRAILDSDVVFSIPKLKTHEKVGLTCGLKGMVGTVAHKDCLAHHRFGSPTMGGDEYPMDYRFLESLSSFTDWLNSRPFDKPGVRALAVLHRAAQSLLHRGGVPTFGAWSGNDTCWRMSLDVARIAHYADAKGQMQPKPCRTHLMLIDGVVAGEGKGPLSPRAVRAGTLLFSDNIALGDHVAAQLAGFAPDALPIVAHAFAPHAHPLVDEGDEPVITFNGVQSRALPREAVGRAALAPPPGWETALRGKSAWSDPPVRPRRGTMAEDAP